MSFPYHGTKKAKLLFQEMELHFLAIRPSSLRSAAPAFVNKVTRCKPSRKRHGGRASKPAGNCSFRGSSRLSTAPQSARKRARSRERRAEGSGRRCRARCNTGRVVHGRAPAAPAAPSPGIRTPYPVGRARTGRGGLPGLEQIKSKERNCRLSKSSSSAIIRRRSGSRWWWRRDRQAVGRADGRAGRAPGPQDSEAATST